MYQIDNGQFTDIFNNTLGTETTSNQAEDNWVGNVFTAVAGASFLQSISFQAGFAQTGVEASIPALCLPLHHGRAVHRRSRGRPDVGPWLGEYHTSECHAREFVTVPFATPQLVATGQVFTAALLIDDVPDTAFPFTLDTSGSSTGSYYDIGSPVGSVNTYNLASPNFPTLNGDTYPGQPAGATNAFPGDTILRVNAVPEPASLTLLGYGCRQPDRLPAAAAPDPDRRRRCLSVGYKPTPTDAAGPGNRSRALAFSGVSPSSHPGATPRSGKTVR